MTASAPRELLNALVHVGPAGVAGVTATFDLGGALNLNIPADRFTYVLEVIDSIRQLRDFGGRIFPIETKAFVFDFQSATQANYDASLVDDRGTSVVSRSHDATLDVRTVRTVRTVRRIRAFGTIEGNDVSSDEPAQLSNYGEPLRRGPNIFRLRRSPVQAA